MHYHMVGDTCPNSCSLQWHFQLKAQPLANADPLSIIACLVQPMLPAKRRTLFFFVGGTRPDWYQYSHAVRQTVMLLNNTPGTADVSIHGTYGLAGQSIETAFHGTA